MRISSVSSLLFATLLLVVCVPSHVSADARVALRRLRLSTNAQGLVTTAAASGPAPLRRFAILQADEFPEPILKLFPTGYSQVFVDWLSDPVASEQWIVYKAYNGELPKANELAQYTAMVITGSKWDAHGTEPWIVQLRALIKEIYAQKIRLLGVCFGSQIISRAIGGDSGRAQAGWELGMKPISFLNEGVLSEISSKLAPTTYEMEYHQDQIKAIPPEGVLLANSPNCPVEMYQVPALVPTVLAVQFHPEFSEAYNRASLAFKKAAGKIPAAVVDAAIVSLDRYAEATAAPTQVQTNPEPIRNLLKQFVRQGLP